MTAFGLTSDPSCPDPRPRADVIPIGARSAAPAVGLAPVSLADAAGVVPVSDKVLWVEYLTLGGSGDLAWFRAHLRSPDRAQTTEHALVVQVFTELFADEGLLLQVR